MRKLPLILIFTFLMAISLSLISSASGLEGEVPTLILVGIVGFALAAGIFALAVVLSYKKKLRGSIYPFDKFTNLELTDYYDKYSHSHTTRYKYKDSSKK